MPRKRKEYSSDNELIKRFLLRDYKQERAGQTKLKHYRATKDTQVECKRCGATDTLHRHRIIPGKEYTDTNVVIVCATCHKYIHKLYDALESKNELSYRIATMLALSEKPKAK